MEQFSFNTEWYFFDHPIWQDVQMSILFWPIHSSLSLNSHEAQFSQNEFLQKQGVNFVYRKWSHYWKRKSQRIDSSKKPSFSRVNVSSTLLTVNVLWSFVKRSTTTLTHTCVLSGVNNWLTSCFADIFLLFFVEHKKERETTTRWWTRLTIGEEWPKKGLNVSSVRTRR